MTQVTPFNPIESSYHHKIPALHPDFSMSSLHGAEGLAEAVLRTSKIQFLRSLQAWTAQVAWRSGAMEVAMAIWSRRG